MSRKIFLQIFNASYTYVKSSLESKLTIDIIYSITRHVKMIMRQEKAIFVGFKKIISWHSHQPISRVKKSFFQTLTRLLFWLVEFFYAFFMRLIHIENFHWSLSEGLIQFRASYDTSKWQYDRRKKFLSDLRKS